MADGIGILNTGSGLNSIYVSIVHSDNEVKVGSDITLSLVFGPEEVYVESTGLLTPIDDIISSSSIAYTWLDHTGNNISSSSEVLYLTSDIGTNRFSVEVIIDGPIDTIITDDDSIYVLDYTSSIYLYNLSYINNPVEILISNMEIYKSLSMFPLWSTASKTCISNSSKLLSPIIETINYTLSGISSEVSDISMGKHRVGISGRRYKMNSYRMPTRINTEFGECYNYGSIGNMNLEHVQVGALRLNKAMSIYDINLVVEPNTQLDLILSKPIRLLLSSVDTDPMEIHISGLNIHGVLVEEVMVLFGDINFESLHQYKMLNRISSDGRSINIKTRLSGNRGNISSITPVGVQSRIVSKAGDYFLPNFDIEERTLTIYDGDIGSSRNEYSFLLDIDIEKILVTDMCDIFILSDNKLYTSKLRLEVESRKLPSTNTNNNGFMYIDNMNPVLGEIVTTTVDIYKLIEEGVSGSFKLSISNGNIKRYITMDGTVSDQPTWIPIRAVDKQIRLPFEMSNTLSYIVELELDSRLELYTSMIYITPLTTTKVIDEVSNIYITDGELYLEKENGKTYNAELIRMGFNIDNEVISFYNDFKEKELIYES